jgi:hypothetical protein
MLRERVGASEWKSALDQPIDALLFQIVGQSRVDGLLGRAERVKRLEEFTAANGEFAGFENIVIPGADFRKELFDQRRIFDDLMGKILAKLALKKLAASFWNPITAKDCLYRVTIFSLDDRALEKLDLILAEPGFEITLDLDPSEPAQDKWRDARDSRDFVAIDFDRPDRGGLPTAVLAAVRTLNNNRDFKRFATR